MAQGQTRQKLAKLPSQQKAGHGGMSVIPVTQDVYIGRLRSGGWPQAKKLRTLLEK
jgi:predicted Rdx family selenoprotein